MADWSARDKAVGLLCAAVLVLLVIALIQGQYRALAMLPGVAVIALLYAVLWELGVRWWQDFFEWIHRRRR